MSAQSFMKAFEALGEIADEAGTEDELICAVFDFCTMLVHYKMGEAAKGHVDKCVRLIRDTLDGKPTRIIREDKLN